MALHRELSRLCDNKAYFLTCRDAAQASLGLSHQTAYNINLVLASPPLGLIKVVNKGKAGPNSRKAAEFEYLLLEAEKQAQGNNGPHCSKDAEEGNVRDYPF